MRSIRRATAILAALSLIVSTMAGARMACALVGEGTATAVAAGAHHEQAAPSHAVMQHDGHAETHGGFAGSAAVATGQDPAVPVPHDSRQATCLAMGPCAFVLLGAPASARPPSLRPPATVFASVELAPASRTLVPDLPPPKA